MENQEELEEVHRCFLQLPLLHCWVVPAVLLGPEVVQVDHLLEVGSAVVSLVFWRKHIPMSAFYQLDCYLGSQSILYLGFASTATPHIPCHHGMRDDFMLHPCV